MSKSISLGLISTNRFILKPLVISDVTDRYAGWLNNPLSNQFILAKLSRADLTKYVTERLNRDNVLFLGVFSKTDSLHIGNIKYEPIDSQKSYAIMGILIGDAAWRGKGAAGEIILASASWLHVNKNINHIVLGVNKSNIAAIQAYQKIGFIEKPFEHLPNIDNKNITMILDLKSYFRAY